MVASLRELYVSVFLSLCESVCVGRADLIVIALHYIFFIMPQGRVIVATCRSICNIGQFLCKNNQLQICFIDFIGSHRPRAAVRQTAVIRYA